MANLSIIKELCAQNGVTITKLAKDLGMSQSSLSMAIKTNSTSIDTLERVSKYFGVPVGVFFEGGDYSIKKLENTLKSIFHTDKDLVIKEWNTIADIKGTNESEDEVKMAWVGLRKFVYSIIERVKQIPIINMCIRLEKEESEHKLGFEDADGVYEDYKHTYAKYTYHQLDDWIWLLKVLKTNENNTDEVLTQILYKGSRYASKSFPDKFFTNDR
jgi:transcriptional regulator with XRE-family HTH domain